MRQDKMEQSVNDSKLFRFLKRETSERENAEILQWVSASEKNRDEFRRIHQVFDLAMRDHYESAIDIDQAWNKLISRNPEMKTPIRVFRANVFLKIAALVALILAVGFGSLWTHEHFFTSHSGVIRIESPAGEKSKVVLADGTRVWLNSQTVLDYNISDPRKVTLSGEAYFDVAKDKKHSFDVITASGLKVTALGTKFNLRNFTGENHIETTLEEGEVIISSINAGKPVRLEPGQQASFSIKDNTLQIKNVSAGIYSLWKNNELRFTDISLKELVPLIERWYGIKIDLDPKINERDRFTMTIKTESLRELLNMMQLTSKFNYEINGEEVKIQSN